LYIASHCVNCLVPPPSVLRLLRGEQFRYQRANRITPRNDNGLNVRTFLQGREHETQINNL